MNSIEKTKKNHPKYKKNITRLWRRFKIKFKKTEGNEIYFISFNEKEKILEIFTTDKVYIIIKNRKIEIFKIDYERLTRIGDIAIKEFYKKN